MTAAVLYALAVWWGLSALAGLVFARIGHSLKTRRPTPPEHR